MSTPQTFAKWWGAQPGPKTPYTETTHRRAWDAGQAALRAAAGEPQPGVLRHCAGCEGYKVMDSKLDTPCPGIPCPDCAKTAAVVEAADEFVEQCNTLLDYITTGLIDYTGTIYTLVRSVQEKRDRYLAALEGK